MTSVKPLGQDNLRKRSNEREEHGFEERGFLTPTPRELRFRW